MREIEELLHSLLMDYNESIIIQMSLEEKLDLKNKIEKVLKI